MTELTFSIKFNIELSTFYTVVWSRFQRPCDNQQSPVWVPGAVK